MQAYKSKVDIIYENILDGIGQGLYKPGERLVISQLAKENATSEIPVREAVRRLESEGFIDMQANKSPYVKGFDPEKAINIFRMKGVLEGYATRLAIDYLTPLDIRHLQEINDEMRACEPTGKKHGDLNMQFHHWEQLQTLVAAHQDRLTNLLLSLLVLCHLQAVKSQLLPQLEENKITENGHCFF